MPPPPHSSSAVYGPVEGIYASFLWTSRSMTFFIALHYRRDTLYLAEFIFYTLYGLALGSNQRKCQSISVGVGAYHIYKGKGKSHIRSVRWGVPVSEDICPEPSVFWGRVASSFPRRLYLPSVSTGSPFAAGWTVSERPTIGSRWVSNRGLRHSRQAL